MHECREETKVLDERFVKVQVVGLMDSLEPGRQSVQVESNDVPLPFVRGVVLREHTRELNQVGIAPDAGPERHD